MKQGNKQDRPRGLRSRWWAHRHRERRKWTTDGRLDHQPRSAVGYESPDGQAHVAEQRGLRAGLVRLLRDLAVGIGAPANQELTALGGVRVAITKWDEANQTQDPRTRLRTADERARIQVKKQAHAQARASRLEQITLPTREKAVNAAQAVLERVKTEYRDLPWIEKPIKVFNSLIRVELAALFSSCFDGLTFLKPLQNADLANAFDRWLVIAFVAAGIWVAVNAMGVTAGLLGLALDSRQRRKGAVLIIAGIAGALFAGFYAVAVLRHVWTEQVNRSLVLAIQGKPSVPVLLDALFLTPLNMAVATAAAALIAIYVMGSRGRDKLDEIAEATHEVEAAEDALRQTEREIAVAHAEAAAADVGINQVYWDRDAAEVELEVIREAGRAEREGELALTQAAVARQEFVYHTTHKLQSNGGVWLAALPDEWWRRRDRRHVAATTGLAHYQVETNGHQPTNPDDVERFVSEIDGVNH